MAFFIFILDAIIGGTFSYLAIRDQSFGRSLRILLLSFISFFALKALFIANFGITSRLHAFVLVLSLALVSMFWCVYYACFFSEGFFRFFNSLITPSSGDVEKEYARGRAYEIEGKFSKAMDEYYKYYQQDTNDYIPLERVARCYLLLNKPKECFYVLQKVFLAVNKNIKMDTAPKKQELARLLFLQKEICKKHKLKEYSKVREAFKEYYHDTKFANKNDPFVISYLEMWQDVRGN